MSENPDHERTSQKYAQLVEESVTLSQLSARHSVCCRSLAKNVIKESLSQRIFALIPLSVRHSSTFELCN